MCVVQGFKTCCPLCRELVLKKPEDDEASTEPAPVQTIVLSPQAIFKQPLLVHPGGTPHFRTTSTGAGQRVRCPSQPDRLASRSEQCGASRKERRARAFAEYSAVTLYSHECAHT